MCRYDKLYSPQLVATIYKYTIENNLTNKRKKHTRTNGMHLTNNIIHILMKVGKLMRWLSHLINLSRRLAIWRLERMKLNCSQQNSIICILLVLKSFIMNRFATKSREFSWDLFRFIASKPYNRIGIHLYFTTCSTTSSEAVRPTLPKCC